VSISRKQITEITFVLSVLSSQSSYSLWSFNTDTQIHSYRYKYSKSRISHCRYTAYTFMRSAFNMIAPQCYLQSHHVYATAHQTWYEHMKGDSRLVSRLDMSITHLDAFRLVHCLISFSVTSLFPLLFAIMTIWLVKFVTSLKLISD